jgi:hypothetical protein
MNAAVSRSARVYSLLARLYPDEMRRRWEQEMADTFGLQLADALRDERWTSVIAVWYYALADVVLIALPLQLGRAALVIPVAAVTGASVILWGLVWALENSLTLSALYHHAFGKLGG